MATESITTTLGAGSGIDIKSLVSQLTAAQFANKNKALETKSVSIASQISGVSKLKSGITGFASALSTLVKGGTLATAPTSSNSAVVTATGLSGAKLGGFSASVEVRQLAAAQSATSATVADRTAAVGTGSFTLTFGQATVSNGSMTGFTAGSGTPIDIAIGTADSSLDGIARAINAANTGVTATILSDSDGARLSLRSKTGAEQAFTLAATEDDDAPGLAQFNVGVGGTATIGSTAKDAIVAVDGVALKRATNSISDLIDGVKLDLISAAPGTAVTLGTSAPTSNLSQAVNDFVETFNQLQAVLKEQTDPVTGSLRSDPAASAMARALRQLSLTPLVTGGAEGTPATLAEIGVRTNRDGTLSVNAEQLSASLARFPTTVEAMFAIGTGASGDGLSAALDAISKSVSDKTTGLGASESRYVRLQDDIADDFAELTEASATYSERLTQQYASMDARVAAYKSTLSFLEQQVKAWNSSDN